MAPVFALSPVVKQLGGGARFRTRDGPSWVKDAEVLRDTWQARFNVAGGAGVIDIAFVPELASLVLLAPASSACSASGGCAGGRLPPEGNTSTPPRSVACGPGPGVRSRGGGLRWPRWFLARIGDVLPLAPDFLLSFLSSKNNCCCRTSLDFHGRVFGPSDVARSLENRLFPRVPRNRALAASMTDFSGPSVLSRGVALCFRLGLRS